MKIENIKKKTRARDRFIPEKSKVYRTLNVGFVFTEESFVFLFYNMMIKYKNSHSENNQRKK